MKEENNKLDKVFEMVEDKEKEFDINDEVCPRIEKYPELPEDEFITASYVHEKLGSINVDPDFQYLINKKGEVKNKKTGRIIKPMYSGRKDSKFRYFYVRLRIKSKKTVCIKIHRLVSSTFLVNDDPEKYDCVNHIDKNPYNNHLNNLEYITRKGNSNQKSGKHSEVDSSKLTIYVASDPLTEEVIYKFNRKNPPIVLFSPTMIAYSIKNNTLYKGYKWTTENNLVDRKKFYKLVGFSGNLNDYAWLKHPLYKNIFVCKEGFVMSEFITPNGNKKRYIVGTLCNGYVSLTIEDLNGNRRSVFCHRVIVEFIEKRYLKKNEIVDHINTNTLDNSFENLRLTDAIGNMNNENTKEKLRKRFIVTNLSGDVLISNIYSEEAYKFIYGCFPASNSYTGKLTMKDRILNNRFLCFHLGDVITLDDLEKRLNRVYYIVDKTTNTLLDTRISYTDIINYSKFQNLSVDTIRYRFNHNKPILDNIFIYKGLDKVRDVLIASGHLNILKELQTEKDTINKN